MKHKDMEYTQAYLDAKENFAMADKNFDANPCKKTAKALSDARHKLHMTPKWSKEDQERLDRENLTELFGYVMDMMRYK